MEWKDIFPQEKMPTMEQIEAYIGGEGLALWKELMDYVREEYKVKPKLSYSICSGKPGWNIKLQKSGKSLGTLYPEDNAFSVFMVISYRLESIFSKIESDLSPDIQKLYKEAGDYMKMGKWIMFKIFNNERLEDYKKMISVKMLGE